MSWTTQYTETASIDNNIGDVSIPTGNKSVSPTETTTYTMTVVNNDGVSVFSAYGGYSDVEQTNTCTATIKVEEPVVPVPQCDDFHASPTSITAGDSSVLTWETTNANRVVINNGIGEVDVDGSIEVSPLTSTTYLLTVFGANNQKAYCEAPVTVTPKVVTECELDVYKSVNKSTANVGDEITYTIKVKNTGTADCTGGGVKIYDVVDTNLIYKNHTYTSNFSAGYGGSPVYTSSDRTLRFNGNVLTPGESGTIVWTGTVKNPTQCGDFVVNNQAKATAKELNNFNTWVYSNTVQTNIDNDCVVAHPTCNSFNITQSTVAPEANLTFNWSTTNVTDVSFNNGIGDVAVDGVNQTFVAPAAEGTYTYVLTFDGNTNNSCVDTVVVEEPVVDAPVCVDFTATPSTIVQGEEVNLAWEVENAVTLGLNNGIGDVTGTTTFGPVSPIANTVYILDVFGADGKKVQCEAPVTVTNPPNPTDPGISIVKRDAIDADDTQAVEIGGTANFEIVVTNTGNEDLVNVVVTDPLEPACDKTIGSLAIGASDTYTCNSTNVQAAFTNVADVTGDSAVDGQTVTDTDPTDVTIVNTEVFTCEQNVDFSASDTSIDRGDSSRLSWNVTGADSVSISEINATGLTGAEDVSPSSDTRYTLTATKAGFDTINCDVTIDVSTGGGGGGGSSSPRCELEISDTTINRGDEITLTWDSSRARELILTDDRGNVLVTTEDRLSDDKDELFDGEITLTPSRDTEYTLRVERGSRDRECVVDVEMDDEIVVLQTRDQAPLVAGISLTEVPYTGFEAGSVMTFMFYALLVAWALYITYVLVIPKTAFSQAPVLVTPQSTTDLMTKAESIRPDVFASLPTKSVAASTAPTAVAPANLPIAPAASVAPATTVQNEVVTDTASAATEVENEAHLHQALLSSGAVHSLIAMTTEANRSETLKKVITDAKGTYPLEDGWVVVNQTRLNELTATPTPTPSAVTGNGSLAEAVVTGNVVAAYEMIGARPMFALADAAADLDALYRNRKGANEKVSDLLTTATKDMSDVQIADMITALTGALDGTYTDEASAVKMAIMKAVKIAA